MLQIYAVNSLNQAGVKLLKIYYASSQIECKLFVLCNYYQWINFKYEQLTSIVICFMRKKEFFSKILCLKKWRPCRSKYKESTEHQTRRDKWCNCTLLKLKYILLLYQCRFHSMHEIRLNVDIFNTLKPFR